MAKTLLDYNSTVVTPITNGVNIPIPVAGGVQIAGVSVFLDPADPASLTNRVELKATIGVEAQLDTPNILVRIWRAGTEIFYDWGLINVHMVEHAPLGVQNYQLIVENQDNNSSARVVGPVVFSAMAIGG